MVQLRVMSCNIDSSSATNTQCNKVSCSSSSPDTDTVLTNRAHLTCIRASFPTGIVDELPHINTLVQQDNSNIYVAITIPEASSVSSSNTRAPKDIHTGQDMYPCLFSQIASFLGAPRNKMHAEHLKLSLPQRGIAHEALKPCALLCSTAECPENMMQPRRHLQVLFLKRRHTSNQFRRVVFRRTTAHFTISTSTHRIV